MDEPEKKEKREGLVHKTARHTQFLHYIAWAAILVSLIISLCKHS
jgi:hypothetical protein